MTEYRFIRPLDVLYLRGNALFGGPGDHGVSLMPPWPSIAAGALRARILADAGLTGFRRINGKDSPFLALNGALDECLGTPDEPGSFTVSLFTLGRKTKDDRAVEPLFPLPADLSVPGENSAPLYLRPQAGGGSGVLSSYPLPRLPVLRQDATSKPAAGFWLTAAGWASYLAGRAIAAHELVKSSSLWKSDPRLGIALDGQTRTASEGQIYTADSVAISDGIGFVAGVDGDGGLVPRDGLLRFGGDGRGAEIETCTLALPEPPWPKIERTGRFRLILASPGLFEGGWRPPGVGGDFVLRVGGTSAHLVAAAVPRAQVISGWDIAKWQPKPAVRAAPSGSVYWFEGLEGVLDGLQALAREGFWADGRATCQRQAEGFNRVFVAAWPGDDA